MKNVTRKQLKIDEMAKLRILQKYWKWEETNVIDSKYRKSKLMSYQQNEANVSLVSLLQLLDRGETDAPY